MKTINHNINDPNHSHPESVEQQTGLGSQHSAGLGLSQHSIGLGCSQHSTGLGCSQHSLMTVIFVPDVLGESSARNERDSTCDIYDTKIIFFYKYYIKQMSIDK